MIAAGILAFGIALLHGKADGFLYDAHSYWGGARTFVTGGDAYSVGWLAVRGAISVVVYAPAAMLSVIADSGGSIFVLAQNAMLISVLAAVVVPKLIGLVVPVRASQIWISSLLVPILLGGFAPYPLLDIWALALAMVGVLLAYSTRSPLLVACGVCFGLAVALRPAYLVPLGLAGLVWVVFNWRRSLWLLLGGIASVLPQVILNRVVSQSWYPWPIDAFLVSDIQTQFAAYVVRYDTVAYLEPLNPRQFYCDPTGASLALSDLPGSTAELFGFFANNLAYSAVFISEKIAASLHWTWATPYSYPPSSELSPLTVIVLVVVGIGLVGLVRQILVRPTGVLGRQVPLILLAIAIGTAATLSFATPETRFALPIVFVGFIGMMLFRNGSDSVPLRSKATVGWALTSALLVALLFVLGTAGLDHPAEPGLVTPEVCRSA